MKAAGFELAKVPVLQGMTKTLTNGCCYVVGLLT